MFLIFSSRILSTIFHIHHMNVNKYLCYSYLHLVTIRFIPWIHLDPKSHSHNTHNIDILIYVKVCLEEEHIPNSYCDGSRRSTNFYARALSGWDSLVPLSNSAFLHAGKHRRHITRRSVVRHFLITRVIHSSTHKFKQQSMLFISHCYKSTLV